MKKVILVVIMSFGAVSNLTAMGPKEPPVKKEAEATVKIQTFDDQEFEILLTLAKQIPVIKHMLEDIGESEEAIPLPNVDGKEFAKIIQILELLKNNPEAQANLDGLSVDDLINLVNACEYLDISRIQVQVIKQLAKMEQSRQIWGKLGKNDLFNKIFSRLERESKTLFWSQHSAYQYFLNPMLIKPLEVNHLSGIILSSDGNKLITWSYRFGTIKIWDMNNLDQAPRRLSQRNLAAFIINSDASKLFALRRGIITILDINKPGQEPRELRHEKLGQFLVSPDDKTLVSWSLEDGTIKIWNMDDLDQTPYELRHKNVDYVVISSDGSKLISWSLKDEIIQIWDMNNPKQEPRKLDHKGLSWVIVSSDGKKLVSWSDENGTIKIWDMNNPSQVPRELDQGLSRVIVSSNGSKLVSWSDKNRIIKIWDMNNPDRTREFKYVSFEGLIITPDGNRLISWSRVPEIIKIWNMDDFDQKPRELQHENLESVFISPDGSKLISWGRGVVKIWNLIERSELDNLNADQIMLMRWLYDNRNELVSAESTLTISVEQKKIYQTLSDRLKNFLRKLFPMLEVAIST